jgi:hypothetical protein
MTLNDQSGAPRVAEANDWTKFVGRAWGATIDALVEMPLLFISACALMVGYESALAVLYSMAPKLISQRYELPISLIPFLERRLVELGGECVSALILAPVAVAVHRHVLLGRVTTGLISINSSQTRQFILWLIAIRIASEIPGAVAELAAHLSGFIAFFAIVLSAFLVILIAFRGSFIFPAVAIGAPSDGWRDRINASWHVTKGQVWKIFIISLIALVPLLIFVFGLYWGGIVPLHPYTSEMASARWRYVVFVGVFSPLSTALAAAVVSLIYRDATKTV